MKYDELLELNKALEAVKKIEDMLVAVKGQKDSIATDLQSVNTKELLESLPADAVDEALVRIKPITDAAGLATTDIIRDKVA